jgi:hypothetical protein
VSHALDFDQAAPRIGDNAADEGRHHGVDRRVPNRKMSQVSDEATADWWTNASAGVPQHRPGEVHGHDSCTRPVKAEILASSSAKLEREPRARLADQSPASCVQRFERGVEKVIEGRQASIAASHPKALA